ncbi:coronin-1B-like isoform X2 [Watersipora subatra]|uniref:coronin-1B-like isoform X2 n=1 Tax=Watersipora subatra TaxID=2589382 RepID=UPI00355B0014
MSRVVRQSKFRHVFGTAAKKDSCYDGLRITKSNWEGSTYCDVNPKYVAIIVESAGGGAFVVQPVVKTGRIERDSPVVGGHKAEVLNVKWCPHHDDVIASSAEDCTVKIWQIPEGGLTETLTEPIVDLIYHQKRVGLIQWHPTASNILASSGADNKTCLWDVGAGEVLAEINLPDILFSISFNMNGEKLVSTSKDKLVRVHNARSLEVIQKGKAHDGAKAAQAAFMRDDKIFTTGFSRMSDRQYALWAVDGSNSLDGGDGPLAREDIDTSNGVMFIFYDCDTNVVFLAGKGDSVIRYFEVTAEEPYVYWLSNYSSNVPQRGMGYMPKRGVNVNVCEIARFFKLATGTGNQGGHCEPIAMTVPRKSELYQDDLYPDTFNGEASLTADEWFTSGMSAGPQLMSMRDHFAESGAKKAKVRASVLTAKKPASTSAPAKPAEPAAPAAAAAPVPKAAVLNETPSSSSAQGSSSASEVAALTDEVKKLTTLVEQYGERIIALETKMADYENTVLNANDE